MLHKLLLRRRQFLTRAGAALTALGFTAGAFAGETGKSKKKTRKRKAASVLELSEAHFEELVGQHFRVSGAEGPVKLKLVDVREHDRENRPLHIRQEPFSLLFSAPGRENLPSGIHDVAHSKLGKFGLFLHEVGADTNKNKVHYEVVFS